MEIGAPDITFIHFIHHRKKWTYNTSFSHYWDPYSKKKKMVFAYTIMRKDEPIKMKQYLFRMKSHTPDQNSIICILMIFEYKLKTISAIMSSVTKHTG